MTDKQIATIEKKELSPIELKVEKLVISSPDDMKDATEYLSRANKYLDQVVAYKESKTKPLNQALKIIRQETKPVETRLEAMITTIRLKMSKYQTEQTRIANEQKDKIASRVGEGKGKLKAETALAKIDEVDTPASAVATDAGAVKFRTVKKFEVMDLTMLPIEYHVADEQAIKAKMSEGIQLAGVRYYEEQVPINFR